jgi:UDP:flavonoid glycosyltransferase YjiC (YdhE family)
MSRIVAFSWPLGGHVAPAAVVLGALSDRGHQVILATLGNGSPGNAHRVPSVKVPIGPAGNPSGPVHGLAATGEGVARAVEGVAAVWAPDALLVDSSLWGGAAAAEALRLPWAMLATTPVHLRGTRLDARGWALAPRRGPWGWLRERLVQRASARLDAPLMRAVNDLRAARGLSPLARPQDRFLRAPLVIGCTAEPFEYPRADWPSTLRMVGPLHTVPAAPRECPVEVPGEGPLVVVATTTHPVGWRESRKLVDVALAALEGEPVRVLVTMPTGDLPGRLPANAVVRRYVPHDQILSAASCLVCHGGAGATHRALAMGVPVVAVPFGEAREHDMHEVARRVEVARAGVCLPADRLTPRTLRAAVHKALRRKEGAARIAAAFARTGGAAAAAIAIEQLIAKAPGRA